MLEDSGRSYFKVYGDILKEYHSSIEIVLSLLTVVMVVVGEEAKSLRKEFALFESKFFLKD